MQKKNNLNKTENIDDKNTDNEEDEDAHALLNRQEDKYFLPKKNIEKVTELAIGLLWGILIQILDTYQSYYLFGR